MILFIYLLTYLLTSDFDVRFVVTQSQTVGRRGLHLMHRTNGLTGYIGPLTLTLEGLIL